MKPTRIFCLALSALICACSAEPSGPARKMGACDQQGRGQRPTKPCEVSFRAIASEPTRYDGLFVSVDGYLAIKFGVLVIYSSEEFYRHGIIEESVLQIRAPVEDQRKIFERYGYRWVKISGKFTLPSRENKARHFPVGYIWDPSAIVELPDLSDPTDRETLDDLVIDLGDVGRPPRQ